MVRSLSDLFDDFEECNRYITVRAILSDLVGPNDLIGPNELVGPNDLIGPNELVGPNGSSWFVVLDDLSPSNEMVFLFCAAILCSDSSCAYTMQAITRNASRFATIWPFDVPLRVNKQNTVIFSYYLLLSGVVILLWTMLNNGYFKLMMWYL